MTPLEAELSAPAVPDSSRSARAHQRPFGRPRVIASREDLWSLFTDPPADFAPISFYFWNGEPLQQERLTWQLEQLRAQGILGTIVSYIHRPDGGIDPGDPPVFSEQWWTLFAWFLKESKRLGMKVGVQDYCIVNPLLETLACEDRALRGAALRHCTARSEDNLRIALAWPEEATVLSARAYRRAGDALSLEGSLDLAECISGAALHWDAPDAGWQVVVVYARPEGFNPMHPSSGARLIERLYAPYAARCPDEIGQTLCVFFQDELDFGNRMPRWSAEVAPAFAHSKGYALEPLLAALWFDLGDHTEKLRMDYADIVTRLSEAHYFRPVFEWHEAHGTLFGHDNLGRGDIAESYAAYGDPFRTMRWFSAPGCDDPHLHDARRFAGFKVNSSIAHLYGRARVWNEGFYGSGWGVTPAQLLGALNEDFAYGATLFNPHALYYTTLGGWWEWAAPDFHFRQPYWSLSAPLWKYTTRLSAVLSSGAHCCDVAILYPIADLEAGFSAAAEQVMDLARQLSDAGIDFDFVDDESLSRSRSVDGRLQVADASYQALVFPGVQAVRRSSLRAALELQRAGGSVLAVQRPPSVSDALERHDPELNDTVDRLFAAPGSLLPSHGAVVAHLRASLQRSAVPDRERVLVLHRRIAGLELYFVHNANDHDLHSTVAFRHADPPERWDAWTGTRQGLTPEHSEDGRQHLSLELPAKGAQLIVFGAAPHAQTAQPPPQVIHEYPLEDTWEIEITPLLDNRYGDFALPARAEHLRPVIKRLKHLETASDDVPGADDHWASVLVDHGPRLWRLGPVPPEVDLEPALLDLEGIDPRRPFIADGTAYHWQPYSFSERLGIAHDPLLRHWLTGPHGLKGRVPAEFLDVSSDDPSHAGWRVYLWTTVRAPTDQPSFLHSGFLHSASRAAHRIWLDDALVHGQASLGAAWQAPWNVPDYRAPAHSAPVRLRQPHSRLLLCYTLEADQRTRAYAAITVDAEPTSTAGLELPWFRQNAAHFDHRPQAAPRRDWFECLAPPGATGFGLTLQGDLSAWLNDQALLVQRLETHSGGAITYRLEVPQPFPDPGTLRLRVSPHAGFYGGAVLTSGIEVQSGAGRAPLGPWAALGLSEYSGGVTYRQRIHLEPLRANERIEVRLGALAGARVWVNNREVGVVLAAPWSLDVTEFVRPGENTLAVLVVNTVANVYADKPSPYIWPEQTASGFNGPVVLRRITTG